ncbi:DUF2481 domain-containing protein [Listeria monocytogenes]|uniref:DUF2481 domain-containing protein n=1 Tax=Listeria monocytogenes TaxID=1639 RepID=A0A5Y1MR07_LISMN|nr:DUF2481 family protein [Listeria monocytogenes]EAA0292128.1 DUF2481 domain-containing protein [Listeria monocytogenes]EAC8157295.1 DUF2481 domain-containing protein [Listeria monocytogenes]EAD5318971.1 DUF2481 domain-containing protein [Listeria monocytogenes]EAD5493659.1 DUF2481 domain-containing protein [Listeria monocytogenes]EAD8587003.1 DUF2481 domain-containing protein [Listeria monocytogenes]
MAVMEMTKNKTRQREIISYIANNDVELNELLKLQKELNNLMKENTEEKQKTYWTKTFDRIVKKKKWAEITVRETVLNYTQRNKKEYYQIFDMNEYQRNKEIWND